MYQSYIKDGWLYDIDVAVKISDIRSISTDEIGRAIVECGPRKISLHVRYEQLISAVYMDNTPTADLEEVTQV